MIKFFLFTTVLLFLSAATGCVIVPKKDNGKHKGWYKKPANAKTKSPGKSPGNGHKKFYRVNAFAVPE
jgi:hypothetical protein